MINSPPDGYTIMFVGPNNAIGQSVYKKLPFNFMRDTTPIAGIMQLTNIMVVPPSLPVKTVAEFIAYAKANPGKINFASSGDGTSLHMSGELFKMMTGSTWCTCRIAARPAAYPDLMTGKIARAVRQPAGLGRIREDRQAARARRHDGEALRCAARRAGDRRDGAGLRGERVLRRLGAEGHCRPRSSRC